MAGKKQSLKKAFKYEDIRKRFEGGGSTVDMLKKYEAALKYVNKLIVPALAVAGIPELTALSAVFKALEEKGAVVEIGEKLLDVVKKHRTSDPKGAVEKMRLIAQLVVMTAFFDTLDKELDDTIRSKIQILPMEQNLLMQRIDEGTLGPRFDKVLSIESFDFVWEDEALLAFYQALRNQVQEFSKGLRFSDEADEADRAKFRVALDNLPKKALRAFYDQFFSLYKDFDDFRSFISLCLSCKSGRKADEIRVTLEKLRQEQNMTAEKLDEVLKALTEREQNDRERVDAPMKETLWKASQTSFIASRREGGRFYKLDIIERLLPKGHFSQKRFASRGQTEDGMEAPLTELYEKSNSDIAVVGDGGIGKTTFLQHLMEDEFLLPDGTTRAYTESRPVLFFIELNRCPDHVGEWYDGALRKTNFITRYIGAMKENHSTLDSVSPNTLTEIEKELQKVPANGQPQYHLLLDGFNEVRTSHDVRSYLSTEISILHKHDMYPNVRIITTSRETQAAYFALEFKNIKVVGVQREEIIQYLQDNKLSEAVIGEVNKNDSLMKCLRIPLYLCMFTAKQELTGNFIPETAGEILYNFFHRDSSFYNARRRLTETRTVELEDRQVVFVLDFVLPYIGWAFEENDVLSMNEEAFIATITDAMRDVKGLLTISQFNPFVDFECSGGKLKKTVESFYDQNGALIIDPIVSCVYDYLGVVYRDQVSDGPFADRIRYAFVHHHFRDYFSAMWVVRLLSMLQCISPDAFSVYSIENNASSFRRFLDERHWQTQKVRFISEILMEHRNKSQLNEASQNWYLPEMRFDEQRVLNGALNYCRELRKAGVETKHILQNILVSILYGRKEYSGLDLSGLDLRNCCLFNITCSRRGLENTLTTNFERSVFSKKSFEPEEHLNNVMEYVYHGKQCFTIDDGGIIKCWDVLSGRLEYELEYANPQGMTDYSRKGYIKISSDGHWLAAKVQEPYEDGTHVYVQVFDLTNPDSPPKQIKSEAKHNLLTYFAFTEDSHSILMLCDCKVVYCVDIETLEPRYSGTFNMYKQSELYADSADSEVFVYTAEYDAYETVRTVMQSWVNNDEDEDEGDIEDEDWDFNSDEEEELSDGIPCELRVIYPSTKTMETLYTFIGEPSTAPTVSFFPREKCFLLYNHDEKQIERFNCVSKQRESILPELMEEQNTPPTEIHPHTEREGECFVMYPNICFLADIRPNSNGDILTTYSISGVEKLIPNSDEGGELEFKTAVIPGMNRFIVGNDTNTYEWDTVNDTVIRKYSSLFYDCTAFFPNATKNRGILVHRHNGVSLFGSSPIKLLHQYCFQEQEYVVDISCYDKTHDVLAMVFARPDHEKVLVMGLATGREHLVFSSRYEGETIENLCFSENGCLLLITTQYRCVECDLTKDENPSIVADSGDNERFAAGHYRGDEIEIAVVEDTENAEPHIKPHCVYYRRVKNEAVFSYVRSWCYLMPELKTEQFMYFIYQDGDLGIGGSNDSNGLQTYWVTSGFFLERFQELEKFFKPTCYRWQENHRLRMEKEFQPLDEIFVWHKHEITNRYHVGNSGFSYIYLADDRSEAIITKNRKYLSYQKALMELTYQKLQDTFQNGFKDVHQGTNWSYAVPWHDGRLVGCYEGYYLTGVTAKENRLLEPIEYTPGISIFGCRFRGIQAEQETMDIIAANGGIL